LKEKNLKLKILFCLALIVNCGGGGSAPPPLTNDSSPITQPTPLFNTDPIKLIDATSYYSHACNDPSFQFLIPVKINEDSYVDFIAHFWCDSTSPAEYDNQPTPDALAAYVSNGFGQYSIENMSVFGEIEAKLGGASRKYARGDINGDGRDDFAFAMNWEDGRSSFDYNSMISNYAKPAIILSSNSGYEIIKLGIDDWGHSVQIQENKVFFAGHSSQVFEYVDTYWNNISNSYPDLSFASFLIYDDYIINSVRKGSAQGLELIKDNKVISSLMMEELFKVNFESWNNSGTNNYSHLGVYNIRGENYFDGMISEMCRKDDLIVATINASKPISGQIIEGGYYSETDTMPVVMFNFYNIENETLTEVDIEIANEEINHNFNFFDCIDVNQDQKKDIVAQVFSQQWNDQENNEGVPEVYINNEGGYFNLDTSTWPRYSYNDDSQGFLFDIDANGTSDLVVFPLKIQTSGDIEIYTTNKDITN
tara:strand:+ start:120 stop:1556 length:1437 start_codon:yes stop_codon:yes gene_type:complete